MNVLSTERNATSVIDIISSIVDNCPLKLMIVKVILFLYAFLFLWCTSGVVTVISVHLGSPIPLLLVVRFCHYLDINFICYTYTDK